MVSSVANTNKWFTPIINGFKDITRFCWDPQQNSVFTENLKDSMKGVADKKTGKRPGGNGFTNFSSDSRKAWNASKEAVKGKSFWGSMWESLNPKTFIKEVGEGLGFAGKSKAVWGALTKRMPLIGNLITVATEVPNVYKAFKEGGFATGMAEVLKSGLKVSAFALGCAVGSSFGGLIGGMALGFLAQKAMSGFIGDSYTEKQEAAAEAAKAAKKPATAIPQTPKEDFTAAQDATKVASPSLINQSSLPDIKGNDPAFTGLNNNTFNMIPDLTKFSDVDSLISSGYFNKNLTGANNGRLGSTGLNTNSMCGNNYGSIFNNPGNSYNNNFNFANQDYSNLGLLSKTAFQY